MFFDGGANGFEMFFDGGVGFGDFPRTELGFIIRLNFEVDIDYVNIVVFESGGDNIQITIAKLFNIEGIFDTNNDMAVGGGNKRSVLKPGRKISRGNLLFDFG